MGLSGGAIAGIVIGCVVFVILKTACKSLQQQARLNIQQCPKALQLSQLQQCANFCCLLRYVLYVQVLV